VRRSPRTAELANLAKADGWPCEDFDRAVLDAAGRYLQNATFVGATDELAKWLLQVGGSLRELAKIGTFLSTDLKEGRTNA
jgi:hypothetical protein